MSHLWPHGEWPLHKCGEIPGTQKGCSTSLHASWFSAQNLWFGAMPDMNRHESQPPWCQVQVRLQDPCWSISWRKLLMGPLVLTWHLPNPYMWYSSKPIYRDIGGACGLPPPKPSTAKLIRLQGTCKVFSRTSSSLSTGAEELSGAGRSLVNQGHWRWHQEFKAVQAFGPKRWVCYEPQTSFNLYRICIYIYMYVLICICVSQMNLFADAEVSRIKQRFYLCFFGVMPGKSRTPTTPLRRMGLLSACLTWNLTKCWPIYCPLTPGLYWVGCSLASTTSFCQVSGGSTERNMVPTLFSQWLRGKNWI